MRILWITNVKISADDSNVTRGGWMKGALEGLLKNYDEKQITFCIGHPVAHGKNVINKDNSRVWVFQFTDTCNKKSNIFKAQKEIENIIDLFSPNVIHIWGTENMHCLSAINAAEERGLLGRTVVNIQGLMTPYEKVFFADIPIKYRYLWTLKELYKRKNLHIAKVDFKKRARIEVETLKKAKYAIGRTDWDKACLWEINPNCQYFSCNETLRTIFYDGQKWNKEKMTPKRIFMSQAGTPIKGLHKMLEALVILVKKYPQVRLFVSGPDKFCNKKSSKKLYNLLPGFLKRDSYENYLYSLAKKNGILRNIEFLGELDAEEMKAQYLKANVFVNPSIIENESNALGEARILGVPAVASYVGGVPSHLGKDHAYYYPFNEPNMLAYYISQVFEQKDFQSINVEQSEENSRCDEIKNAFVMYNIYISIENDNN